MDQTVNNQFADTPAPRLTVPNGNVRVALIGCGAAARELHLPVLSGYPGVRVVAVVDRDQRRAGDLAKMYSLDATILDDVGQLNRNLVDAAIVCTPPFHHAECAIQLAERGLHALVEKPMATRYKDAVAMVEAADKAGVVLSITVFRRLLPATRTARALLESGLLGPILDFDIEEGEVYNWPTATLGNMRRDLGGGGTLIDFGSHTLDRLLFLVPGLAEVVEFRDNSLGGIESDCRLRCRIWHQGRPLEGTIELSRTRKLRNSFRFRCEGGTVELHSGDRYRVTVTPAHGACDGELLVGSLDRDQEEAPGYEQFCVQLDDWISAIRSGQRPQLDGRSVLPSLKLIEECYERSQPLKEAWVLYDSPERDRRAPARPTRKVLVTGATGFIGGRVTEILRLREGWDVRALAHNPSHASRLARLPVEIVMGDLRSDENANRLVEGCDAVVHCAIGTAWGNRRDIFNVTVNGTERLTRAALARGVQRFVHLSTFAIHDLSVPGEIDESTPVHTAKPDAWGTVYAESKARAEQVMTKAARNGLSALVLRLANVYGPFGTQFVTRPLEHLARNQLVLVGPAATTPSATIYVDNVAEAIVRALDCRDQDVRGQVFTISQDDNLTWADFYGYFSKASDSTLHVISDAEFQQRCPVPRSAFWRWPLAPFINSVDVVTSPQMWALVKRVLKTEPIYSVGTWTLDSIPPLGRLVRQSLGIDTPPIYERRRHTVDVEPFYFELTRPAVSNQRAQQILGYRPVVQLEDAMRLTLEWARYACLFVR